MTAAPQRRTLTIDAAQLVDGPHIAGLPWTVTPAVADGVHSAVAGALLALTDSASGVLDSDGTAAVLVSPSPPLTWLVVTIDDRWTWPIEMPDRDAAVAELAPRFVPPTPSARGVDGLSLGVGTAAASDAAFAAATGRQPQPGDSWLSTHRWVLSLRTAAVDDWTSLGSVAGPAGPPGGFGFFASAELDFAPVTSPLPAAAQVTRRLASITVDDPILPGVPFLSSYSGAVLLQVAAGGQHDLTLRIVHTIGRVSFASQRQVSQRIGRTETFTLSLTEFIAQSVVQVGPWTDADGQQITITDAMLAGPTTVTIDLVVARSDGADVTVESMSISGGDAWFSQIVTADRAGAALTHVVTEAPVSGDGTVAGDPVTIAEGAITADRLAAGVIPDVSGLATTAETQAVAAAAEAAVAAEATVRRDADDALGSRIDGLRIGDVVTVSETAPDSPADDEVWIRTGASDVEIFERRSGAWTPVAAGTLVTANPSAVSPTAGALTHIRIAGRTFSVAAGHITAVTTAAPVSGDGSAGDPVTVADGAIGTDHLADRAVTSAKLGVAAVLEANLGPRVVGAGELKNDAVTGGAIRDAAVTSTKVKDEAIVGPKLAPGAVTAGKVAAGAIGADQLAADAVTADALAASAVTADALAASAVTADALADAAVTADALAASAVTADKVELGVIAPNPTIDDSAPTLGALTVRGADYRVGGAAASPPTGGAGQRTVLATLDKSHVAGNADLAQAHATVGDLHHGELVTFVLSMVQVSTSESWAVFGARLTQGDVPTTDPTGLLTGTDWRRVSGGAFRNRDTPAVEVDGNDSGVLAVEAIWDGADGADSALLLGMVLRSLGGTTAATATLAVIRAAPAAPIAVKSPVGRDTDGNITIIPSSIRGPVHVAGRTIVEGNMAAAAVSARTIAAKATYRDAKSWLRGGDNVTVTPDDTAEQIVVAARQSGRPIAPPAEGSFWGRAVGQADGDAQPLKLRAIDSHDQRAIQDAYGYIPGGGTIADQNFAAQSGNDFTRWNCSNFNDDPGNYDASRPGLLIDRTHNQLNPNGVDFSNATAGTTSRVMRVRVVFEPDNQRDYGADEELEVWIRANPGSRIRTPDVNTVARHTWHFAGGNQEPFDFTFDLEFTGAPRRGTADGISINLQFRPPSSQVVALRGGVSVEMSLPALGAIPAQPLTAAAESTFRVPGDRSRGIIGWHVPDTDDHTGRNAPGESDRADVHLVRPAGWPSQADAPFLQAAQDVQQARITMAGNIASDGPGSGVLLMHRSPAAGIGPTILATVPHPASGAFALDHTAVGVLGGDEFWVALSGTGLGQGTQQLTWDANLGGGKPLISTVIAGVIHTVDRSMATGSAHGQQLRTVVWSAADYPALVEAAEAGRLEEMRIASNGYDSAIPLAGLAVRVGGADPVDAASRDQPTIFGLAPRSSESGPGYEGRLGANLWIPADRSALHCRFQSHGTSQPRAWIEQIDIDYGA